MPTVISEKIRSRLEHLSSSVQAIHQRLLEQGNAIIEAQRGMQQDLEEGLREGLEREALLGTLAAVRAQAEQAAQWFGRARAIFDSDPVAVPTIEAQLREAERFLAWLRDLEARVSAPARPFDGSGLPPAPGGPTAEGYISVSEARARVRAGKRP